MQGSALPNITTTSSQQQQMPSWYTGYLQQLAECGAKAAHNAQFVGATDLQNQAFKNAAANVGNYQPALGGALSTAQGVANQCISQLAQSYMNPYTQQVVNAIGNLGQSNIAQNLAPGATAGIVGSGQFGSSRGAGALGQVLANAGLGITAQQACALQKGYNTALCAAQKQITDQLAASRELGNVANLTGALATQCLSNLSTLGAQQRCILQQQQCFPMTQLMKEASLLRGFQVPGGTASTYTGPIPGAYNAAPLSQIAGLGALTTGLAPYVSSAIQSLLRSCNSGGGNSGGGYGCYSCAPFQNYGYINNASGYQAPNVEE